jgi:Tfp pilus assembly protein PilX
MHASQSTRDAKLRPSIPARQRGVALLIGMVILLVLALLGASAYSVATQDERIAGNARDRARAVENAETILRECENYIQTGNPVFDGTTSPGMYPAPPVGAPWLGETQNWSSVPSLTSFYTLSTTSKLPSSNYAQAPACVAEEFALTAQDRGVAPTGLPVGQQPSMRVAHVTARGWGLNKNTQVTLVSYVAFF